MHPDRRRAGRAIRKQRRLQHEQLQRWEEFGGAARRVGMILYDFAKQMTAAFGPVVEHFSRACGPYWTIEERKQYALVSSTTAVERSEPWWPNHPQVGGQALRSAPAARGGVTFGQAIYDEPITFTEEDEQDRSRDE